MVGYHIYMHAFYVIADGSGTKVRLPLGDGSFVKSLCRSEGG